MASVSGSLSVRSTRGATFKLWDGVRTGDVNTATPTSSGAGPPSTFRIHASHVIPEVAFCESPQMRVGRGGASSMPPQQRNSIEINAPGEWKP